MSRPVSRAFGVVLTFMLKYAFIGMIVGLVLVLPWQILRMAHLDGLYLSLFDRLAIPRILGHLISLVLSVGIVAVLGWLAYRLLRRQAERVPALAWFLRTLEDATAVFRKHEDGTRPRVVIVAWPNPDVQTVGILVRPFEGETEGEGKVVVYMPNTPNPLSGVTKIISRDQITETDWDLNDVLAFAITRGAAVPREAESPR